MQAINLTFASTNSNDFKILIMMESLQKESDQKKIETDREPLVELQDDVLSKLLSVGVPTRNFYLRVHSALQLRRGRSRSARSK